MILELKTLPPARLAYMRNAGIIQPGVGQLWGRFTEWLAQHPQPGRSLYGITQDNPETTPVDTCRYDVGVEVDHGFKPDAWVQIQQFGGGRYACALFTGGARDIGFSWMKMYREWMPQSGHQRADAPAVELYEPGFLVDKDAGTFRCWLCVPVA
jgi:AraC family transcriptional regulator